MARQPYQALIDAREMAAVDLNGFASAVRAICQGDASPKSRGTKMKSEFENWFVNQFGTRSKRALTDSDLREEIASAEAKLFHARRELESRHIWDAWHDAALKAWCARDCKGKKKEKSIL